MTLFQAFGQFAGQAAVPAVTAGMVLIKPASVGNSGGSASIGANGQITATGVTAVYVNECFSADYTNYMIAMDYTGTSNAGLYYRLRVAGVDASASNYTVQRMEGSSTTVSGGRESNIAYGRINNIFTSRSSCIMMVYAPFLTETTASRSTTSFTTDPILIDFVGTHSLTTSYDGITIYPSGGDFTGKFAIYGLRS